MYCIGMKITITEQSLSYIYSALTQNLKFSNFIQWKTITEGSRKQIKKLIWVISICGWHFVLFFFFLGLSLSFQKPEHMKYAWVSFQETFKCETLKATRMTDTAQRCKILQIKYTKNFLKINKNGKLTEYEWIFKKTFVKWWLQIWLS